MGQESRCRNDRTSYPQGQSAQRRRQLGRRPAEAASNSQHRRRGWMGISQHMVPISRSATLAVLAPPPPSHTTCRTIRSSTARTLRAHLHFTARPTEELCIPGGELQLRPPLRRHRIMHVTCGLGDQCARTAPEGAAIARAGLSRRRPALRGSGAAPAPYYALPWARTLVTLRCKLKSRSGLALGPLGAPEYESRVNSRSRVPLPTFFCRSDHPEWCGH